MDWLDLPPPESGATVAVGMSGGVDSTLIAVLLKERGCRVIGVTMSSWADDLELPASSGSARSSCYGPDEKIDIEQCRSFCAGQGISHFVVDVREAFRREVLEYFKAEYRRGRTPNPCVRCNPAVKFGAMLDGLVAAGVGFDYFCTGHYARLVRPEQDLRSLYFGAAVETPAPGSCRDAPLRPAMVASAADQAKDQSYFLCRVPSRVLERVRFPLASYTKGQVFRLAREKGLAAAARAESQDFIPEEYFDAVFSDKASVPGDMVDLSGRKLGVHRGIERYTVGQRRGLGVSSARPLYVHSIDAGRNRIVLAESDDLLCRALLADDWVWAGDSAPEFPFRAQAKIRLASRPCDAVVKPEGGGIYRIEFSVPQRAVAPGQSVVVYLEGATMGGGVISKGIA